MNDDLAPITLDESKRLIALESLKIEIIRLDSGTQSRAGTSEESITDYAERMAEGDKFPPVEVFFDGNEYHLADGFHRALAASRCGFKDILANIHKGSVQDAIWFAIGANKANGMKRTSGDKRKAIEIALVKFPEKTQQQIAEHVGCTQQYVTTLQKQLTTCCKLILPATRTGKDGKSRPTSYKKKTTPTEAQKSTTVAKMATIVAIQNESTARELARVPAVEAEVVPMDRTVNMSRTFPAATKGSIMADFWWFSSAKPDKRGEFFSGLLWPRRKVEVSDKESFRKRVLQWLDEDVIEKEATYE